MLSTGNLQSAQNCANNTNQEDHKNFLEKVKIYLKLISEATLCLSNNMGSLRRDIWQYLIEIYNQTENTVDYRDFLHSIRRLLKEGKLLSEQGLFRVEENTFREIWEKPPTPDFNRRPVS